MSFASRQRNQGNLGLTPFSMQRRRATHEVTIGAPMEEVFERTCGAGQPGWLRAGSVRRGYSESGMNERYALWSESETGPVVFGRPQLETHWSLTMLDPENRRCRAVLGIPGLTMGALDVAMKERDERTVVRFDLSVTAISQAGAALFDAELDARIELALRGFGDTLTGALADEAPSPDLSPEHQARRERARHTATITGDLDRCFALACPVAELEWIDGWNFDLIYSESGRNETDCVFLEPSSGLAMLRMPGADTCWYSNRYDAEHRVFEAVWLTRDLTLANFEVRMTDLGDRKVKVAWNLAYTGLGPEGNRVLGEAGLAQRMKRGLEFLSTSLKHYVETGEVYRSSNHDKLRIAGSLIGAALGRHFRGQRASE